MRLMVIDLQVTLERKEFVEEILVVGRYEGRRAPSLSCMSGVCFMKGNWSCIQTSQSQGVVFFMGRRGYS